MSEVMDAYVRVSRVGGRGGEEYRSPAIQIEAIQNWAKQHGVDIGKVEKEEDVSGARPVAQRKLEQLIRRAEEGQSRGVLVYRLDRFGRDLAETVVAVKRLKDANARLVSVADGYDSDAPMGSIMLGMLAGLADWHLAGIREGWRQATSRAVDEGKHVASKAPLGYLRADRADPTYDAKGKLIRDGRLVLDPDSADAVRAAFDARAVGASHREVVKLLEDRLGRNVAKSAVTGMLRNRVYLGEARGPHGASKEGAHEAIVPSDLWERVQSRTRSYEPRKGTVAEQALLGGLITCASCGHKLRVSGTTYKGQRRAQYVCVGRYAAGDCHAPAVALASLVDQHVALELAGAWEEVTDMGRSAEAQWVEARELVAQRQEALDLWVNDPDISLALSPAAFTSGLAARQKALDEARQALWLLDDPGLAEDAPVVWIDGKPQLYEVWGEDLDADRRLVRRHIAAVTLAKADPKRRRWQPIAERVEVRWVGQDAADT